MLLKNQGFITSIASKLLIEAFLEFQLKENTQIILTTHAQL